jgi:ATP-dependent exoDNAse (exonuclease V) beta subunit
VRTFARDLGRHPDFDIQMDMEQVLEEVVDRCLDQVGRDADLTQYLKSLILFQMEEGRSWNPKKIMLNFSKSLVSEKGIQALDRQQGMTLEQFAKVRSELFGMMNELEKVPKALAQEAFDLLSSCSIVPSDHYYSGIGAYFKLGELAKDVIADADKNSLIKVPFQGRLETAIKANWIGGSTPPSLAPQFKSVAPRVKQCLEALYGWYHSPEFNRWFLLSKITRNFFALGLIHYLYQVSELIKEEKNFLMIDDFHQMVSKVIAENHAPFIYEKVGERYEHILFDEFQDTSDLQWRNFLPLVQECLAKEGSVFVVGDGKQSIYRWRNGNVQQFVELPMINETPNVQGLQSAMQTSYSEPSKGVNNNYRSGKNIVQFNNEIFEQYRNKLGDHNKVYDDHQQAVKGKGEGMVQLNWCADLVDPKEKMYSEIIQIIQSCLKDGFQLSDITILTRKGKKESGPIAQAIKDYNASVDPALRIAISTQDSFLLSLSPKVRLVMAYLTYLSAPRESYYRFDLSRCLAEVFPNAVDRGQMLDACMEHWQKEGREGYRFDEIKGVLEQWNASLPTQWPTGLSAFEMAKSMMKALKLEMDEYLEFLLDQLAQRAQSIGFQPAEMRRWWEKAKDKLCINAAGANDAVKMMTVHRSTGLEFPVVIYPRFNSTSPGGFLWLDTAQDDLPIQDALVNNNNSKPQYFHPNDMVQEYWDNQLDTANLIYVAQTRPTQRLYILQEFKMEADQKKAKTTEVKEPSKFPKKKEIEDWSYSDYLYHYFDQCALNVGEGVWRIGTNEPPLEEEKKPAMEIKQMGCHLYQYAEKKLRYSATKREELAEIWEKGKWGEQVHVLLQKFVLKSNWDDAVELIKSKFDDVDDERCFELKAQWSKAEKDSRLVQYREANLNWSVEQPILLSNGEEVRPDLFCIADNVVRLIDFKTGKPKEKDDEQILGYAAALNEICQVPVQPSILYTHNMEWKNH